MKIDNILLKERIANLIFLTKRMQKQLVEEQAIKEGGSKTRGAIDNQGRKRVGYRFNPKRAFRSYWS